ncbi:TAP26 protein, partial [Brachypteracias leptosomus]|nr:TAP26 protein [Brachypteracias leptosomus]
SLFLVFSGRGFAFCRKQKIERQYRKLLKKGRKIHSQQNNQFTETYPEHLKHLYLAEEEMLKKRRRPRNDSALSEEKLNKAVDLISETMRCHYTVLPQDGGENKQRFIFFFFQKITTEREFKKKTSNQKAKEEYEKIMAERARKKEEAEKRKQQREAAQRLYKQKKMEAYKVLSKKTKRGQPNLNLQVEFLLQKIQQNT